MANDPKLQALQKAYKLEEQQALDELRRIEDVVQQRQKTFDKAVEARDAIGVRLKVLREKGRSKALHRGDGAQLAAIGQFERKLAKDFEQADKVLAELNQDLEKALERAAAADKELVAARIEKKKVERFLENRQQSERVLDAAREEAQTDEMNFFRRRK